MRLRLHGLVTGIVVGFVAGLAAAVVAPTAIGWRTLSVMSGSMSPTINTGDAVVTRPVAPGSLRSGDVVTFRDPSGSTRLITHRVRAVRTIGASLEVTTKGDANSATERWQVARDGRVGRVAYRLPMAGYVLAPSASPLGRLGLIAVPTFLLGALSLAAIWRRQAVPGPPPLPQPARLALPAPVPVRLALPPGRVLLALPAAPVLLALPAGPPRPVALARPPVPVLAHAAP